MSTLNFFTQKLALDSISENVQKTETLDKNQDQAKFVFTTLVQSVMDYADTVWSSCLQDHENLSNNSKQRVAFNT